MTINVRLKQLQLKIKDVTDKLSSQGEFPDPRTVSAMVTESLPKAGDPTVELIKVEKHKLLNIPELKKFVQDVNFDLRTVREILLDYYDGNLSEFIKNSTRVAKISKDVSDITQQLEAIKGVAENDYIDFIQFNFSDSERIESGFQGIDTNYKIAELPIKRHYSSRIVPPIAFLESGAEVAVDIVGPNPNSIILSTPLANSSFKNVLLDTNHTWMHLIRTKDYNGSVKAIFTIPLDSEFINKVIIEPQVGSKMNFSMKYSTDGSNVLTPLIEMSAGESKQFRFERVEVSSITIEAELKSPTNKKAQSYEYIFGFRLIALHDDSHDALLELETKQIEPELGNPIRAVELAVKEIVPDSCDIEYFVSGKTFGGTDIGPFPIRPFNRNSNATPDRVEISGTNFFSGPLGEVTSELENINKHISFYKIGQIYKTHYPDIATMKVFRGLDAWRISDNAYQVEERAQTRIDLRSDKDATLFFYKTEDAIWADEHIVTVTHKIDFNRTGQEMIPSSKDNIDIHAAIASVQRVGFQSPIGFGLSGSGDNYYISNGINFPILKPLEIIIPIENADKTKESSVTPEVRISADNAFFIDITEKEQFILGYGDGVTDSLKFNVRTLLKIKGVTQNSIGIFTPIDSAWRIINITDIAIIVDGVEESLVGSSAVANPEVLRNVALNSLSLSSLQNTVTPSNSGLETKGFILIPNDEHVAQSPEMFKINNVNDLIVPFPVSISTATYTGIYEVDRVTLVDQAGLKKPALIISNPEKLGSKIPTLSAQKVTSWQILSQNLTTEVEMIDDDKIHFKDTISLEPGDTIEVQYRVSGTSTTIHIMPETVKVINSQTGDTFTEQVDYIYSDGVIHSLREDRVRDMVVNFSYRATAINTYTLETNLYRLDEGSKKMSISTFDNSPYRPDTKKGEVILFDNQSLTTGSVVEIKPGWHTVKIVAKDITRLVSFSRAINQNGVKVFSRNGIFNRQAAYKEPLTYVDPDQLYNSSLRAAPKHFTIKGDDVIISFNPEDLAFTNTRLYDVYKGESLDEAIESSILADLNNINRLMERFDMEYSYVNREEDGNINDNLVKSVKLKMVLRRSINADSSLTPIINEVNLRIF